MNELQITLLVIALVFLAGLYGLHLKRKKETQRTSADPSTHQPEPAQSPQTQASLFDTPETEETPAHHAQQTLSSEGGVLKKENGRLVLKIEDPFSLEPVDKPLTVGTQTNFGRPVQSKPKDDILVGEEAATREPRLFAIMVIGTHTYSLHEIRTALLSIGMVYDEKEQIFVRKNEQGKIYLRAANALDPGTFPAENDETLATPGIALILQLPTYIHAPPAMDQMIKDARKLSQRLGAHIYNMDRSRINEPDLKKMRNDALDYVSVPLK